jgi:deazaflavin-dependent oxidoreductase (nitroreductase family)
MALKRVDPTAEHGPARRAYASILRSPPGRWFAINVAAKLDPVLLRRTGGRVGCGLMIPSALLETTGAKSGSSRANPILYFHDGDDVILVASNYGRDKHPAWRHNLRANPACVLGDEAFTAVEVDDEAERTRLWRLADQIYPGYADYRDRTAKIGRRIPIVRLTPR